MSALNVCGSCSFGGVRDKSGNGGGGGGGCEGVIGLVRSMRGEWYYHLRKEDTCSYLLLKQGS